MNTLGPLSTALEAQLRQRLQQNRTVIWLDRDGRDTELVDQLQSMRAEEQEATRRTGRGDNRLAVSEMGILDAGLWSVLPEKVAATKQRLSDRQGALFSLRAPDAAEGRAVVDEQSVQGGLFAASGASQPGSVEQRGTLSC